MVRIALVVSTIVACQPSGVCGFDDNTLFPDILVRRTEAVDADGKVVPGVSLRREYADGSLSSAVPNDRIENLDPTQLKGRSAMTVILSAPGYVDARVNLPETCEVGVTPLRVVMTRLP